MPFQATVYRILIASPNDVTEERKTIQEIISSWNAKYFHKMKALLIPVMWETHSVQEASGSPKVIFNKQIAKDCDILIGAFWTRIGTDTELAESSTIEEIKEFQKAGKPVMMYFSMVPVVPSSIDLKQYEKLMKFMDDCLKQGIAERYDSIHDFREKSGRQIASMILKIHNKSKDETSRDPVKTAKAESNDTMSKKFSDLVEGYKITWTREKKIEPINLDDGRRILKDLEKEISGLRVQLAKIFDAEIIENIDQIVSKLKKLQKHRLYLDRKSYTDFWKLGDEIFSALNGIVGRVRKDIHGPKIDNNI